MLAKAKAAAADATSKAKDVASKAAASETVQKAKSSAAGLVGSVRSRAEAIPPEERKLYSDVATTVLTLASACGSKGAGRSSSPARIACEPHRSSAPALGAGLLPGMRGTPPGCCLGCGGRHRTRRWCTCTCRACPPLALRHAHHGQRPCSADQAGRATRCPSQSAHIACACRLAAGMAVAEIGAKMSSGPVDSRSLAQGAASVAGAVGGPKTRAAAAVAGAVSRVFDAGRDGESDSATRDAGGVGGELVVLRVVATVPGGSVMPVQCVPTRVRRVLMHVAQCPVGRCLANLAPSACGSVCADSGLCAESRA